MAWDTASIYNFDSSDDVNVRLRRVERGRQTLRSGAIVAPSSNLRLVNGDLLTGDKLNLASAGLVTSGSIPATGFSGKFGFTATTSAITVYFDGTNGSVAFTRLGADGTVKPIATGSMTISGLAANTPYGFLPFYSAYNACGIGWVLGDSGAPQFAFTAAAQTTIKSVQQALIGREPMTTGFITYSTTAAGGSSGGGGGGVECVMLGTDIEPIGEHEVSTVHHPCSEWIHLQARDYPRSLNCTPDHPLYHAVRGKIRADEFKVGDPIITDCGELLLLEAHPLTRVCTKVEVKMPTGHLFWANGYMSHNLKKWP